MVNGSHNPNGLDAALDRAFERPLTTAPTKCRAAPIFCWKGVANSRAAGKFLEFRRRRCAKPILMIWSAISK